MKSDSQVSNTTALPLVLMGACGLALRRSAASTGAGHRVRLHSFPTYSPDTTPIERVSQHRCRSIEELLDLVMEWLHVGPHFQIEPSRYKIPLAA